MAKFDMLIEFSKQVLIFKHLNGKFFKIAHVFFGNSQDALM